MESLALVFEKFTTGLANVGKSIVTFMNNVKTWFTNVIDTIVDRFTELGAWFWELPGRIWDSFKAGLELLFIPQEEITIIEEVKELIKSKFPFINQAETMINTFIHYSDGAQTASLASDDEVVMLSSDSDSIDEFSYTIYGVSGNIIDLSLLSPYIGKIHSIIIFLAWFGFIRRLYTKIPVIIAGVGGSIDISDNNKNGG